MTQLYKRKKQKTCLVVLESFPGARLRWLGGPFSLGWCFFHVKAALGWGEMEVVGVSNMWYQVVSGAIRELKTPKYRWQIKNLWLTSAPEVLHFEEWQKILRVFFLASLSSWKNFFKLSHLRRGAIFIFAWKSLKKYWHTTPTWAFFGCHLLPLWIPNFWGCPKRPTEVCVPLFLVLMISLKKCGMRYPPWK